MTNENIQLNYYKLERASKIIECEVDDIIHLWLSGAIKLYVDLKGEHCYLTRHQYSGFEENELNIIKALEEDPYKNNKLSKSLKWFSYDSEDVTRREIKDISHTCKYIYNGRAYGIWEVSATIVTRFVEESIFLTSMDDIDRSNSTNESCFVIGASFKNQGKRFLDYLSFENLTSINKKDLVIMDDDLNKLKKGSWSKIPSFINELNAMDSIETKLSDSGNIVNEIHPTAERHSKNRLDVVMAAINFKENYENEFNSTCIKSNGDYNFTEWARQVLDRPALFPNCEIKIKSCDTVQSYISAIFKDPDQRK